MPDVFGMGEFVAYVRAEIVQGSLYPDLDAAASDCPVNAISLLQESGYTPNDHDEKSEDEEEDG